MAELWKAYSNLSFLQRFWLAFIFGAGVISLMWIVVSFING